MSIAPALRIKDVAELLRISDGDVLDLVKADRLRAFDVSHGTGKRHRWRITEEALADFMASRTAVPPPKASRRRSKSGWQYHYF